MHISSIKDNALRTLSNFTLYIPAMVCFVLAFATLMMPQYALLNVVLLMAMVGGICFSVARKVIQIKKELNVAVNTITSSLTPKSTSLSYKQFRTAGPNSTDNVPLTINAPTTALRDTVIAEGVTPTLSLTPQELEELKKKIIIH